MQLAPGTTLGPYRILASIGAGGMGEVYRARDEKLDRDVAVKVLPARLASDAGALARFEREAKAVATLSHPNILSIHDFGQSEGRAYAVMELLEGETLREILATAPLGVRRAVELGGQIAAGLAAAHDRGITHRDLKPENLFLTRDGLVKILDFGLATQPVDTSDTGDTSSPTMSRGTLPGTVMGTAGYMAPEQVRGERADSRADIFAFGAVLHEMLSGRRAFERTTSAETMTAILREEAPSLGSLRPDVPPALERVVEHCLEKRADDRFQSARDLGFALAGAASPSGTTSSPAVPEPSRRGRPRAAGRTLAAVLALGLAAGVLLHRKLGGADAPTAAPQASYLTYSGKDYSPDASPDGRAIAFRSDRDGRARIWLKQLATGTEVPLTGGPFDDQPRFSPDGATVLFTRRSGDRPSLFRVPLLGGEPRRVVDDATDGAWSPDGSRIAFLRLHLASPGKLAAASLMVAASDGGGAQELARVEASAIVALRWSPRGDEIALRTSAVGAGTAAIEVIDVQTGARRVAVEDSSARPWTSTWTPEGSFVYTSGQIVPGAMAGTAGRLNVLDRRTGEPSLLYASPDSLGHVTGLGGGRFVVETQGFRQNIVEWLGPAEERPLSRGRAADRQPVYTPDGESVIFSSDRSGNLDLWEVSLGTGALRQITEDPADDWDPAVAPDGRLYWSSDRSGQFEVWTAASDGSGARQVTRDGVDAENPGTTPDGRWVVYGSTRPGEEGIWKVRSDGSEASLLVPGLLGIPEVSPDGRYVLYLGFEADLQQSSIQVARLEDGAPVDFAIPTRMVRPTTANLGRARWMPDGRIAFLGQDEAGTNGIFVQDFEPGRDTSTTRRKLAGFDRDVDAESFAISSDGSRIALAGREIVSSLVLLEGVRLDRP